MSSNEQWWRSFAPYWQHLEDRHLGTLIADSFSDDIAGPVLVIGGGQGLVIEHLRKRGLEVHGVDLSAEMIAHAKKRRHIDIIRADAAHLPFETGSFRTAIIATGIVDYIFDEVIIRHIIDEARRVTMNNGDLFIAFYRLGHALERINRGLGVITQDNRYYLKRIFDIMRAYENRRFSPVKLIAEWTGRPYLTTLFYWGWVGLTLPALMRHEQKTIQHIFELAKQDGLDPVGLCAGAPSAVPYRGQEEIRGLVDRCGIKRYAVAEHPDCIVVRHHTFGPVDARAAANAARPSSDDWIIRTENLKKVYRANGCVAVDALTITIQKGSIFGILGPNGAGKTTTLSMLSGITSPTSGVIEFSPALKSDWGALLGYVPQELALYERLTARDNLSFFGALYDIKGETLKQRIAELLELIGLSGRADEPISGFSQGMLRRLNLAIGLIHEPGIVLMDEPTVGIDPQSRNRIFDTIWSLKNRGTTILYTTHYMEEAARLCDQIAIMDHGKVILNDAPAAAVEKYGFFKLTIRCSGHERNAFVKALRRSALIESIDVEKERLVVMVSAARKSTEAIAQIERLAESHGMDVLLENLVAPSLESLFLDITGRNLRDMDNS